MDHEINVQLNLRLSVMDGRYCRKCGEWKEESEFPRPRPHRQRGGLHGKDRICRECHVWENRFSLYGITKAEFDAMLAAQGNRCGICGTDTPTLQGWHVDHDHENGKVRGILCKNCNVMLGCAKDNPDILRAGSTYLECHVESLQRNP